MNYRYPSSYRTSADEGVGGGVWSSRSPAPYEPVSPVMMMHQQHPPVPAQHRSTTVMQTSGAKPTTDSEIYRVGIYGWRKRCLYVFILMLTLVIVVNLAVTIWIITVLDLSADGMGALKILDNGGIRVTGRAEFDKPVHFNQLSTDEGEALSIDSSRGIRMSARNITGHATSSFNLFAEGRAEAVCDRFEILNSDRKLLFFADTNEIGLKLENLRILDDGGSVFDGAIQTAIVRPEPDGPLRIESPTRNLFVDAAQDIELLSRGGDIKLTSLLDIDLISKQGDIRLDSGTVYVSGIPRSEGRGQPQYQLCVCENGRLFMAMQSADCRGDRSICDNT